MKISLKGWQAVIAAMLFLGFAVIRLKMQNQALQTQGVEEVRRWLLLEYARETLPKMEKAMENPVPNRDSIEDMAKRLAGENLEIISVTRHGNGERIVVRVEFKYKGESKEMDRAVRYLIMSYSLIAGWRVEWESSEWRYYLAAFGG